MGGIPVIEKENYDYYMILHNNKTTKITKITNGMLEIFKAYFIENTVDYLIDYENKIRKLFRDISLVSEFYKNITWVDLGDFISNLNNSEIKFINSFIKDTYREN